MRTGYDLREVINDLPPRLQLKLLDSMYRKIIIKVRHVNNGHALFHCSR
eukprot:SAG22_NODE_942_length_6401_cov_9.094000_3_plen_49_part_00